MTETFSQLIFKPGFLVSQEYLSETLQARSRKADLRIELQGAIQHGSIAPCANQTVQHLSASVHDWSFSLGGVSQHQLTIISLKPLATLSLLMSVNEQSWKS